EDDEGESTLLLKEAAEQALGELVRMRQTEGAALSADLGGRLAALEALAAGLTEMLPVVLRLSQGRLDRRIPALLAAGPADPGRIVQEAAMLAARSDVAEELARLTSHCRQFRTLLAAGGPIGRQLDFLLQEMHREVNTIASKADDQEMVGRVLDARTVVERLREQAQNVE